MKDATLPSVRVDAQLRAQLESVLQDGESLTAFVEASVRDSLRRRIDQAEFVTRGLASIEEARRTGDVVPADEVVARLRKRLAAARQQAARRSGRAAPR